MRGMQNIYGGILIMIVCLRTSRVRAGVLNLRKLGSVERRILRKIEHPEYKNPQVYFDIALVVLDQGIIMKLSITKQFFSSMF